MIRNLVSRSKLSYMLYNLFQWRKLRQNTKLYKRYGINKKYFSSISSRDFEGCTNEVAQSEFENKSFQSVSLFNRLNENSQQSLKDYDKNGFAILREYLDEGQVNAVNEEIDKLLKDGKVSFRYRNKIMFAIKQSTLLKSIGEDHDLNDLLSFVMKDKVKLFQSINFLMGSEQKAHSDSVHMTTYPVGGLLGVWIALEDIGEDNGPLFYYPGSHKLPYYMNRDFDNEGNWFMLGNKGYSAYEDLIEKKVEELKIPKLTFEAKKGDLIIWHANLIHGGEPHLNKNKTRKSMVFHYFGEDYICYHEITQRPALIR